MTSSKTFIQTAVRLYIQVFSVSIGDVQQLLRIAVNRAAVIDFKLHAEMPQALAMEHEVGRVAVFVNDIVVLIPAGCAVGVVAVIPVCSVTVDNTAAIVTAHVIFIKAMIAEYVRVILDSIFLINPFVAVVADYGQPVGAVLAEPVSLHFKHIFNRLLCTAVCTNSCFTHCLFLHFV